jgi:hypothetical protein
MNDLIDSVNYIIMMNNNFEEEDEDYDSQE